MSMFRQLILFILVLAPQWACASNGSYRSDGVSVALEDQFGKLSQVAFSYISESGTIARGAFRLEESLPDDDEYLKELPF